MKASEKEALVHECLIKNYEKYYRMAYSYVFCEQDAMDIVQEGAYRAILKSDLLKQPEYEMCIRDRVTPASTKRRWRKSQNVFPCK